MTVSDRFTVKPLLPLLVNDARYYVLALSQKAVRLLDCSRDHILAKGCAGHALKGLDGRLSRQDRHLVRSRGRSAMGAVSDLKNWPWRSTTRNPGDDELLDLAAVQTLMHAGTVYGWRPRTFPAGISWPPSIDFRLSTLRSPPRGVLLEV